MDDNAKRIVEGLRRCAEQGIDICDGIPAATARRCDGCPNQAKMESGSARGCFESWLEAAESVVRLYKAAEAWKARAEAAEMDLTELAVRCLGNDECVDAQACEFCKDGNKDDCPNAVDGSCFVWRWPQGGETNESNDSEVSGRG